MFIIDGNLEAAVTADSSDRAVFDERGRRMSDGAPIRTTCPYCGVGCGVIATPTEGRTVRISEGRYTLDLPLEPSPELLLAELTAAGAQLASLNPIRETLEDVFVESVTTPDVLQAHRGLEPSAGSGSSRARSRDEDPSRRAS